MPNSEVVFDYAEPLENYPDERRAHVIAIAESAAARGEPWLSLFDPAELAGMLHNKGFATVEDLGMAEIADRFYGVFKQGHRDRSRRAHGSRAENPRGRVWAVPIHEVGPQIGGWP